MNYSQYVRVIYTSTMQANDTDFDNGHQVQQVMTEQHRGGECKLIFG